MLIWEGGILPHNQDFNTSALTNNLFLGNLCLCSVKMGKKGKIPGKDIFNRRKYCLSLDSTEYWSFY